MRLESSSATKDRLASSVAYEVYSTLPALPATQAYLYNWAMLHFVVNAQSIYSATLIWKLN